MPDCNLNLTQGQAPRALVWYLNLPNPDPNPGGKPPGPPYDTLTYLTPTLIYKA